MDNQNLILLMSGLTVEDTAPSTTRTVGTEEFALNELVQVRILYDSQHARTGIVVNGQEALIFDEMLEAAVSHDDTDPMGPFYPNLETVLATVNSGSQLETIELANRTLEKVSEIYDLLAQSFATYLRGLKDEQDSSAAAFNKDTISSAFENDAELYRRFTYSTQAIDLLKVTLAITRHLGLLAQLQASSSDLDKTVVSYRRLQKTLLHYIQVTDTVSSQYDQLVEQLYDGTAPFQKFGDPPENDTLDYKTALMFEMDRPALRLQAERAITGCMERIKEAAGPAD